MNLTYIDHQDRLFAFIEATRLQPYAWGTNDCVTFPANAILAMTGFDPAAKWRGKWNDEASAKALLEAEGGLLAIVQRIYPVRRGRWEGNRGDLAAVKMGDGTMSLGIVLGTHAAAPGDKEMLLVPMQDVRFTWNIWAPAEGQD